MSGVKKLQMRNTISWVRRKNRMNKKIVVLIVAIIILAILGIQEKQ